MSDLPAMTFLSERLEKNNLGIERRAINQLNVVKMQKMQSMIDYLTNVECRENFIISYFDEKAKSKCGRCDSCLGSYDETFNSNELNKAFDFLQLNLIKPTKLDEVLHWWPHNKRSKIIAMLSLLENEEKINLKNGYLSILTSDKS